MIQGLFFVNETPAETGVSLEERISFNSRFMHIDSAVDKYSDSVVLSFKQRFNAAEFGKFKDRLDLFVFVIKSGIDLRFLGLNTGLYAAAMDWKNVEAFYNNSPIVQSDFNILMDFILNNRDFILIYLENSKKLQAKRKNSAFFHAKLKLFFIESRLMDVGISFADADIISSLDNLPVRTIISGASDAKLKNLCCNAGVTQTKGVDFVWKDEEGKIIPIEVKEMNSSSGLSDLKIKDMLRIKEEGGEGLYYGGVCLEDGEVGLLKKLQDHGIRSLQEFFIDILG